METFYAFALTFSSEHPLLAWCALWLLWAPFLAVSYTITALKILLRHITLWLRGWPPAHLDADGAWKPEPKEASK